MSARITIDEAIEKLRMGGVVALPTETVYGLAALATLPEAIKRVYTIKNRPADNPLICHFSSIEMIERYTQPLEPYVKWLMQELTPGPVSFLLNLNLQEGQLLKTATCGSESVVCRIPEHWLALSVIKQLNTPLAAPSANTSGHISPTSGQMVLDDIGDKIDGVVDGGPCLVGLESTILDCRTPGQISILRPGAIGADILNELLNAEYSAVEIISNVSLKETTPGAAYRHYAPYTEVKGITRVQANDILFNHSDVIIGCDEDIMGFEGMAQLIRLGSTTDAEQIARHLYNNLQRIDEMKASAAYYIIHIWGASDIERAIANRIEKAFGLLT